MSDCYAYLDQQSEDVTRTNAGFDALITPEPWVLPSDILDGFHKRYEYIKEWQETTLTLFNRSMVGDFDPMLMTLVFNDLPDYLGLLHHQRLLSIPICTPVFFRTDEVIPGKITEVQCPGSLWGIYEQLYDYYTVHEGENSVVPGVSLSQYFARSLTRHLARHPVIHHLLDNASNPGGERYFIQKARKYLTYYSYDKGVNPYDCNFIRGHDFMAIIADIYVESRLESLAKGRLQYDLPPSALFDQKITLSLPFGDKTRSFYSDHIRNLFPFTQLITRNGFRLEDDTWVTLEEFSRLPRNKRQYFIKYAGANNNRNWGSRAVFYMGKLSQQACEAKLNEIGEKYSKREFWIIQKAYYKKDTSTYITRQSELATLSVHSKYSGFYGPDGLMGILLMQEPFYKVHGSKDTIMTVVR